MVPPTLPLQCFIPCMHNNNTLSCNIIVVSHVLLAVEKLIFVSSKHAANVNGNNSSHGRVIHRAG